MPQQELPSVAHEPPEEGQAPQRAATDFSAAEATAKVDSDLTGLPRLQAGHLAGRSDAFRINTSNSWPQAEQRYS